MRKEIFDYVNQCLVSAETKGNTGAPAPLLAYPIPDRPWGRVHLDTLELPLSESGFSSHRLPFKILHSTTHS